MPERDPLIEMLANVLVDLAGAVAMMVVVPIGFVAVASGLLGLLQ